MGSMLKFEGDENEFMNTVKEVSILCGNENWFEELDCYNFECLMNFWCFFNIVRALVMTYWMFSHSSCGPFEIKSSQLDFSLLLFPFVST